MTSPSVDEGDAVDPEVGEVLVRGALQALPDHAGEVALEPAGVAVRVVAERVEVEGDPADHVVLRIRAAAGERVVNRQKELGAHPRRERVPDASGVELRA